jgi:hypothetical protein
MQQMTRILIEFTLGVTQVMYLKKGKYVLGNNLIPSSTGLDFSIWCHCVQQA